MVVVERKALLGALRVLSGLAARKTTVPLLGGIRLSANGNLLAAATDVEHYAVVRLPVSGEAGKLEALLPAKRLLEVVRAGKDETVTLESQEGSVRVDAATLVGLDPSGFPTLPQPEGVVVAELGAAELAAGLQEVEFAVARELTRYRPTRYSLTGVLLHVTPQGVSVVASDGKQLAARRLHAEPRRKAKAILHLKAVRFLEATARLEPEAKFRLYMRPERNEKGREKDTYEPVVHFVAEEVQLSTRLVEGQYPDWKHVIPDYTSQPGWRIGREALLDGLAAAALPKKNPAVRFQFRGSAPLELYTRDLDVGEARATVPVETIGGGDVTFFVNPLMVKDYLASLPREIETITLHWSGDVHSPTVWTTGEAGSVYLLMTVNDGL